VHYASACHQDDSPAAFQAIVSSLQIFRLQEFGVSALQDKVSAPRPTKPQRTAVGRVTGPAGNSSRHIHWSSGGGIASEHAINLFVCQQATDVGESVDQRLPGAALGCARRKMNCLFEQSGGDCLNRSALDGSLAASSACTSGRTSSVMFMACRFSNTSAPTVPQHWSVVKLSLPK
jgi:hypothetical protein